MEILWDSWTNEERLRKKASDLRVALFGWRSRIKQRASSGIGTKFNFMEVLKVLSTSQEIDNSLRKKQLSMFKADKRIREREGIEPDRRSSKRTRQ